MDLSIGLEKDSFYLNLRDEVIKFGSKLKTNTVYLYFNNHYLLHFSTLKYEGGIINTNTELIICFRCQYIYKLLFEKYS